eukprot:210721_1
MPILKTHFMTLIILINAYQATSASITTNEFSPNITMIQFQKKFNEGDLVSISWNNSTNKSGIILQTRYENTNKHLVLVQFGNNRSTYKIHESMLTKLSKCFFHIINHISDQNVFSTNTQSFQQIQSLISAGKYIILPVTQNVKCVFKDSHPIFGYCDRSIEKLFTVSKFLHELVSTKYIQTINNVTTQTSDSFSVINMYKIKHSLLRHLFMTNVQTGLFDILCYWDSKLISDLFGDIRETPELKNMHPQVINLYAIHKQIRTQDPYSVSPHFLNLHPNISNAFEAVFYDSIASEFYIDIWITIATSLIRNTMHNARNKMEMLIDLEKFNQPFIESFRYYCDKINELLQESMHYTKISSVVSKIKQITDTGRLIILLDLLIKTDNDIYVFIENSISDQYITELKKTLMSLGLKSEQQLKFAILN